MVLSIAFTSEEEITKNENMSNELCTCSEDRHDCMGSSKLFS